MLTTVGTPKGHGVGRAGSYNGGEVMTDHKAFEEGYDAYWEGFDSDANPYDQHPA
jgi:hypothetical protein